MIDGRFFVGADPISRMADIEPTQTRLLYIVGIPGPERDQASSA
jgi:hypothetical protein